MTPDLDELTPAQEIVRTMWLLLLLAAVLWAVWERFTQPETHTRSMEPVREVVEARPGPLYLDSVQLCDTTGLSDEVICYHLGGDDE